MKRFIKRNKKEVQVRDIKPKKNPKGGFTGLALPTSGSSSSSSSSKSGGTVPPTTAVLIG